MEDARRLPEGLPGQIARHRQQPVLADQRPKLSCCRNKREDINDRDATLEYQSAQPILRCVKPSHVRHSWRRWTSVPILPRAPPARVKTARQESALRTTERVCRLGRELPGKQGHAGDRLAAARRFGGTVPIRRITESVRFPEPVAFAHVPAPALPDFTGLRDHRVQIGSGRKDRVAHIGKFVRRHAGRLVITWRIARPCRERSKTVPAGNAWRVFFR